MQTCPLLMQAFESVRGHKQDQLRVAPPPRVNITLSPVAGRRSSLEERRRPAARFKRGRSASQKKGLLQDSSEEENPAEDVLEDEEDEDGDDRGELSPLLPIFSAEHLGWCLIGRSSSLKERLTSVKTHSPFTTSLIRCEC